MKISLSHTEYTKGGNAMEVSDGVTYVDGGTARKVAEYARLYRTSKAGVVALALAYYFGDGDDHLQCEFCSLAAEGGCLMPEQGEQTTIPVLDKGIVVVGLSTADQGK